MEIYTPLKPRPEGNRRRSLAEKIKSGDRPPITHGYFKSFDSTKIFYSVEGQGKPLIFCYGLVCSSLHWTYQIDHFAQNYQSIWMDYRGHHNSEVPRDLKSLTIENLAHDLRILMDELDIKDAVLLGHSMGVNVVLEFYRQNPDRVAGMVLANGTARRPLETMFRTNAFQTGFKYFRKLYDAAPSLVSSFWKVQGSTALTKSFVAMGGFNPHLTPREDIDFYVQQVAEMDPRILLNLIENYDLYDATPWLHTVKVPTLIFAGEQDRVIPPGEQELMHQLIPQSEYHLLRHGSHCPQMDLPELVNLQIEQFLSKMSYRK
jgi:non-heme chloroperoxidase